MALIMMGYINEPWKYNVNYSYVGHFGGPLMGTFCFIVGSWIAEESLDKNEYSYLLVVVMALIWPLSKMIPRGVAARQKLVKRFKRSEPGSILSKLNQLLPYDSVYRKKNLRYVSQRYLADSDTYKCLLLPIKSDYPVFRRLVTERWKDLNDLSADYLDIYY